MLKKLNNSPIILVTLPLVLNFKLYAATFCDYLKEGPQYTITLSRIDPKVCGLANESLSKNIEFFLGSLALEKSTARSWNISRKEWLRLLAANNYVLSSTFDELKNSIHLADTLFKLWKKDSRELQTQEFYGFILDAAACSDGEHSQTLAALSANLFRALPGLYLSTLKYKQDLLIKSTENDPCTLNYKKNPSSYEKFHLQNLKETLQEEPLQSPEKDKVKQLLETQHFSPETESTLRSLLK